MVKRPETLHTRVVIGPKIFVIASHKRIYTEVALCVPLIINHGPYPHFTQFQRSQSIYINFKRNRADSTCAGPNEENWKQVSVHD